MENQILKDEIIESYTLEDIYEEIENFSEITSDLVLEIQNTSLLNNAKLYLTNLSF